MSSDVLVLKDEVSQQVVYDYIKNDLFPNVVSGLDGIHLDFFREGRGVAVRTDRYGVNTHSAVQFRKPIESYTTLNDVICLSRSIPCHLDAGDNWIAVVIFSKERAENIIEMIEIYTL